MTGIKGIFDGYSARNHSNVIAMADLREQAKKRLHEAHQRAGAPQQQATGGDSLLGSMFLNMLGMGALGHMIEQSFGHMLPHVVSQIPHGFISGAFEAAAMVRDEKSDMYRARKLSDYPEGRRQDPLAQKTLNAKFNMVANNDNFNGRTALEEVAAMAEIIDMIDALEKDGFTALNLDERVTVYDTLKQVTKRVKKQDFFTGFVPHRKAV